MRRDFFNAMVENGAKVADWREAFTYGQAKATGVEQYLRLIEQVVEKAEERQRHAPGARALVRVDEPRYQLTSTTGSTPGSSAAGRSPTPRRRSPTTRRSCSPASCSTARRA